MERYKTEILTVEGFLEERPDMEVHTDKTIQSAIYQVAGMLNAKTGGLIQKVWDYSVVDRTNNGSDNGFTQPDPNCVYFRTPEQLAFIKQAFVEQTQYNINLGNDYTQGGGSYSMGNVNASFSRPESRDIFAPMVEYLLQQAKVLDLQDFLVESRTTTTSNGCETPALDYDTKCLTENYANLTYLKIYQPDANVGRIATVNNANIITFEPVQDVFDAAGGLKAKEIWDPVEQIYKQINQFGVEYFGGLTKQQVYDAIYASGVVWNPQIPYQKDWVVMFQLNDGTGNYKYAKSLVNNNLGNDPNTSPEQWEILPVDRTELQVIFDYIDNKLNEFPQVNYISEGDGEIIQFNSQADYETFKTTMEVDDSYFQDITDNIAYKNESNTFTQTQKFDRIVEMGQSNGTQAYLLPRKGSGKSTLKIGNSPNNDDKRFDIDLENRSKITNVPTPTQDGDVVNKEYVDTQIANISSGDVYTNRDNTLTGNNTFTGDNTFINRLNIDGASYFSNQSTYEGNVVFNNSVLFDLTRPQTSVSFNQTPRFNGGIFLGKNWSSVGINSGYTLTIGQIGSVDTTTELFLDISAIQGVLRYQSTSDTSIPLKFEIEDWIENSSIQQSNVSISSLVYEDGYNNGNTRTKVYTYQLPSNIEYNKIVNIEFVYNGSDWLYMNHTLLNNGKVYFYFIKPNTTSDFSILGSINIFYKN